MNVLQNPWLRTCAIASVVLPWLWPIAQLPTPSVQPMLFGLACMGLLGLFIPSALDLRLGVFLGTLACWIVWRSSHLAEAGLAVLCLVGIWLCAAVVVPIGVPAVAHALLWAALLSAGIGLLQYGGGSYDVSPWLNSPGEGLGVAFGNLRQRNQLATLCCMGLAVWLLWPKPWGWRLGFGLLLLCGLAATASRTGVLQVLGLGLMLMWWTRGRAWRTVLGLWVLFVLISTALPMWVDQAGHGMVWSRTPGREGCGDRRVLWQNAWELIVQRPWDGWGWRGLAHALYSADFEGSGMQRFCDMADHTHHFFLQWAAELGLPITVGLTLVVLWWMAKQKPWQARVHTQQWAWCVLMLIGLHSLLEYPLWYAPFQMTLGFALGALQSRRPKHPVSTPWHQGLGGLLLGMVLVCCTSWGAWDYWRVTQLFKAPQERASSLQTDTFEKVQNTRLFDQQVQFARLTTTPIQADNAQEVQAMAHNLMRFSPEPVVVERLIESTAWLGDKTNAQRWATHYQTVYPKAYAAWYPSWVARQCPDLPPCFSSN